MCQCIHMFFRGCANLGGYNNLRKLVYSMPDAFVSVDPHMPVDAHIVSYPLVYMDPPLTVDLFACVDRNYPGSRQIACFSIFLCIRTFW